MGKHRNVFGDGSDTDSEDEVPQVRRKPVVKHFFLPKDDIPLNKKEESNSMNTSMNGLESVEISEITTVDDHQHYMEFPIGQNVTSSINTSLFQSDHKSVGLSIMEKMGFKVGQSLGQDNLRTNAMYEPITVIPRKSRMGIGAAQSLDGFIQDKQVTNNDIGTYRERISDHKTEEKNQKVWRKLMKLCYELSGGEEDSGSQVNSLWKVYVMEMNQLNLEKRQRTQIVNIGDDKQNEIQTDKQINSVDDILSVPIYDRIVNLLTYLRSNYKYCYYCGCFFEDMQDMSNNCPGMLEEEHINATG